MNGCESEWKKTLEGGGRGMEGGDGKRRKRRRRGQGEEREKRKLRAALKRVVSVWTSHEPGVQVEKQLWRMDSLPYLLYSLH